MTILSFALHWLVIDKDERFVRETDLKSAAPKWAQPVGSPLPTNSVASEQARVA
jgi:hypothetical protein